MKLVLVVHWRRALGRSIAVELGVSLLAIALLLAGVVLWLALGEALLVVALLVALLGIVTVATNRLRRRLVLLLVLVVVVVILGRVLHSPLVLSALRNQTGCNH